MISRRSRLGLFLVLLLLSFSLVNKGRHVPVQEQAVFVFYSTGSVVVGIKGDGVRQGVYRFHDGIKVADVKKMAVEKNYPVAGDYTLDRKILKNGDQLNFREKEGSCLEIDINRMSVLEFIALGIPLDPNRMSFHDWLELPGIGPTTARNLMSERQINGDYREVESLSRASGVGSGRILFLKEYFKVP